MLNRLLHQVSSAQMHMLYILWASEIIHLWCTAKLKLDTIQRSQANETLCHCQNSSKKFWTRLASLQLPPAICDILKCQAGALLLELHAHATGAFFCFIEILSKEFGDRADLDKSDCAAARQALFDNGKACLESTHKQDTVGVCSHYCLPHFVSGTSVPLAARTSRRPRAQASQVGALPETQPAPAAPLDVLFCPGHLPTMALRHLCLVLKDPADDTASEYAAACQSAGFSAAFVKLLRFERHNIECLRTVRARTGRGAGRPFACSCAQLLSAP